MGVTTKRAAITAYNYFQQGCELHVYGAWGDAVTLSKAAELEPGSGIFLNERGMAYLNAGDLDPRHTGLYRRHRPQKNHAEAPVNRAKGDDEHALLDAKYALEIDLDYAAVYTNRVIRTTTKTTVTGPLPITGWDFLKKPWPVSKGAGTQWADTSDEAASCKEMLRQLEEEVREQRNAGPDKPINTPVLTRRGMLFLIRLLQYKHMKKHTLVSSLWREFGMKRPGNNDRLGSAGTVKAAVP
jgi:hypothetical protein